ncbi:MAG: hypothetical protein FJ109_17510 [Deltaproteobacteria bacterium]|nr:hypothetical protein [Deltaproteobacteria bacterium]
MRRARHSSRRLRPHLAKQFRSASLAPFASWPGPRLPLFAPVSFCLAGLAVLLGLFVPIVRIPEARAELLFPCLQSSECPPGTRCNWGLCEDSLFDVGAPLFQVSVLDMPDLSTSSGTRGLRERLAEAFAQALRQSGTFSAVRHGGAYPVDTLTLFKALDKGSAYVLSARLVTYDGSTGQVKISLVDAQSGAEVEPLGRVLALDADNPVKAAEEWVNAAVLYFTGRPGVLGVRLAVVRKMEQGVKEVFVLTYGRDDMRQITFDRTLSMLPAWTHDGRLAWTSYRDGAQKVVLEGLKDPFCAFEGLNSGIVWSRDGSTAAVTLSKDGDPDIYLLVGTTGEELARLTFSPGIDTSPSWSPTGTDLAFVSDREGTPQIFTMRASGEEQKRVTFAGFYNTSPNWHPFGPYVVYSSQLSTYQIFRLDLRTGETVQLTSGSGDSEDPEWSPDGRLIAYAYGRGKRQDIYVMNADGSNPRRLTSDEGPYYTPAWEILLR